MAHRQRHLLRCHHRVAGDRPSWQSVPYATHFTDAQVERLAASSWAMHQDGDLDPSGFAALSEREQEANRDHIRFLPTLVRALGYQIEDGEMWADLPEEVVEAGARLEHLRWVRWTRHGPHARPDHPGLIPYDELAEPTRRQDRARIRELPVLLATERRGLRSANTSTTPVPPFPLSAAPAPEPWSRLGRVLHVLQHADSDDDEPAINDLRWLAPMGNLPRRTSPRLDAHEEYVNSAKRHVDSPLRAAPWTESRGGTIYLDGGCSPDEVTAALRALNVQGLAETHFVAALASTATPRTDHYLVQMRLIHGRPAKELYGWQGLLIEQPMTLGDAVWAFMEDQREPFNGLDGPWPDP